MSFFSQDCKNYYVKRIKKVKGTNQLNIDQNAEINFCQNYNEIKINGQKYYTEFKLSISRFNKLYSIYQTNEEAQRVGNKKPFGLINVNSLFNSIAINIFQYKPNKRGKIKAYNDLIFFKFSKKVIDTEASPVNIITEKIEAKKMNYYQSKINIINSHFKKNDYGAGYRAYNTLWSKYSW